MYGLGSQIELDLNSDSATNESGGQVILSL